MLKNIESIEKSNDELIEEVEKLKRQIKSIKARKKYGLVWEDEKEPEQIVLDCQYKIPILKEVKSKELISDKNKTTNVLIEGDNYHALSVLNYTHKNKIDAIYIDPPYNTGARDWKYNNNYVGEEDTYRHSKWLTFMRNRLVLCKNLLKEDGIICVTIDDYELPTLWLLLEQIFGPENHLGTVTIRNYPSGRKTKRKVAQIHEYAIFFGKSKLSAIKNIEVEMEDKSHNYKKDKDGTWYSPTNLRKQGVDSQAQRPDGTYKERWYPIYYDPETGKVSTKIKSKIGIWPIDPKGEKRIWRRSKEVIDQMYKDGEIWGQKTNNSYQIYFKFRGGVEGEPPKSIWYDSKFSASEHGTSVLAEILGKRETFPYPKSVLAIEECIKIMSNNKNALILDFFAGSGTTAQAVLEMNIKDMGNRKFIVCTNNENNICDDVTYPRIKNVIEGYNFTGKEREILFERKINFTTLNNLKEIEEQINEIKTDKQKEFEEIKIEMENNTIYLVGIKNIKGKKRGVGGNLKYFRTELLDIDHISHVSDEQKIKLTYRAGEMIALREDTFEEVEKDDWWQIFKNETKYTAIYFKEDKKKLNGLVKRLAQLKEIVVLYVFSWGKNEYKNEYTEYKNIKIEDIPEPIIDVYKEVNRLS